MHDNNSRTISSIIMRQWGIALLCCVNFALSCAWLGPERSWDNPFDVQGTTVVALPIISTSFTDTTIAVNDSLLMEVTAIVSEKDTVREFRWSFDDTNKYESTPTGFYRRAWEIGDTGIHRIRVLVRNAFDMSSDIALFTVTIRSCPPRISSAPADTLVAQSATVVKTFSASDSNGTIAMYLWDLSGSGWDDSAAAGPDGSVRKSFSKDGGGAMKIRWAARDDDGLLALDTFELRFNRGPDSVRLVGPAAGDTARFVSYDNLNSSGRIRCSFVGHDPDMSDTLTYTFWIGTSVKDTALYYRGRDTSVIAEKITASTIYLWKLSVRDMFGDGIDTSGTLVTAPPPAPPAGMVIVRCAGKDFQMGQSGFDTAEAPIHTVIFSESFWMDTVEVTAGRFADVMGSASPPADSARLPMVNVSWFDAALYCNALSKRDGRDTVYVYQSRSTAAGLTTALVGLSFRRDAVGYRLPSEAEWEYACRLDSVTLFFWGNDLSASGEYAWTKENSNGRPHGVASKKPNRTGLYDMAGNAWEWCNDWFDPDYYSTAAQLDPAGPQNGTERVLRGGSWNNSLYFAQAGTRSRVAPQGGAATIGFRTVLTVR